MLQSLPARFQGKPAASLLLRSLSSRSSNYAVAPIASLVLATSQFLQSHTTHSSGFAVAPIALRSFQQLRSLLRHLHWCCRQHSIPSAAPSLLSLSLCLRRPWYLSTAVGVTVAFHSVIYAAGLRRQQRLPFVGCRSSALCQQRFLRQMVAYYCKSRSSILRR